ncbi:hypothetical protein IYW40_16875 [Methylocystis sp. H4A]|uniref:hypothetical protein n=1 Tax=Methylocystis sp. H4A TaxID=2785788 RepID=UPI0018C20068|nr:hypothetical protein [Methylocystis sp. H4A]MBG0803134.1 hypothetical protein [Methylocystis sp. H4A]
MSGDKILQEILESDWTLGAFKRREDTRRSSERSSSPGGADTRETRRAHDGSGNNWIAEAFRRRQEDEREKAARHQSRSAHTHAASKEVPVDNWLIEGFKRHQQEERRRETIAGPDEAEAAGVSDDHSISDLDSSPSDDGVAVERISLSEDRGSANQDAATGANDEASATALVPLVSRHDGTVLDKPPRRAGRTIMIAGLIVVGGLVSVIGVTTALWGPFGSTNDANAPGAPQKKTEKTNRSRSALPKAETSDAPAPKLMENGSAPKNDAATHPSGAAPARPSDAAIIAAPPAETPENSKPNPVAPGAGQGSKAPSPSQEREQGDKALHGNEAAPAATLPAPVPRAATEAASPAKPDKNSNAEPAAVAPERSREQIRPDQEQNASESKRGAVNTGADAKPKHQAKDRNASHQTSRKPDGFSTFLKRTANSVRKFFGRLGEKQ